MKQRTIYAFALSMMLTTLTYGQKVGGDRDTHGCIGSAGYIYSSIKDSCIQPWMEKTKLQGVGTGNVGFIAPLIFSKDKKKAEVLMPKGGVILTRKGKTNKYVLAKDKLELTVSRGYYLRQAGTIIFQLD